MDETSAIRSSAAARWTLLCVWTVLCVAGCASFQLPRIDPTGESLLIWPDQSPPTTPFGAPPATPTFATPSPLANSPGNVRVPPVLPDLNTSTVAPLGAPTPNPFNTPAATAQGLAVTAPTTPQPTLNPGANINPAATVVTPTFPAATGGAQEQVRLFPQRVLAPVGSEVILKAGMCAETGYLLANQRIEWLLSREGVGEFTDVFERDQFAFMRWPWDMPRKVDNWYMIGSTAAFPLCLNRGTTDPSDDLQLLRGEGWVSLSSAVEGTSYVTAYAPAVGNWTGRQASATVYWVDVQWQLPESTLLAPGTNHTLTTVLTRRTDGAPLADYIVRYEIVGAETATIGYDAGQASEVRTDGQGRASIEISPTDAGGGSSTVNVKVIRPPQAGKLAAPQLELGSGTVNITWGAGGASPAPTITPVPDQGLEPGVGGLDPIGPGNDNLSTTPPSTYTPPPQEQPPGEPRLEIRIANQSTDQPFIGDLVDYLVTIRNVGDAYARNVVLRDQFDLGLRKTGISPNENDISKQLPDLAPGQEVTEELRFEVTREGRLCHEVTATADGASDAFERACLNASRKLPPTQPALSVRVVTPNRKVVGQLAETRFVIQNVGDVAVMNLEVTSEADPSLLPESTSFEHERLSDGRILWRFPTLEPGQSRSIPVDYRCAAASRNARVVFTVTADQNLFYTDEGAIEILPPLDGGGGAPTSTLPGGGGGLGVSPLRYELTTSTARPSEGGRMTVTLEVTNPSTTAVENGEIAIAFPAEIVPDSQFVQAPVYGEISNNRIAFQLPRIEPGERLRFVVPASVVRRGTAEIVGQFRSEPNATPQNLDSKTVTIEPKTL